MCRRGDRDAARSRRPACAGRRGGPTGLRHPVHPGAHARRGAAAAPLGPARRDCRRRDPGDPCDRVRLRRRDRDGRHPPRRGHLRAARPTADRPRPAAARRSPHRGRRGSHPGARYATADRRRQGPRRRGHRAWGRHTVPRHRAADHWRRRAALDDRAGRRRPVPAPRHRVRCGRLRLLSRTSARPLPLGVPARGGRGRHTDRRRPGVRVGGHRERPVRRTAGRGPRRHLPVTARRGRPGAGLVDRDHTTGRPATRLPRRARLDPRQRRPGLGAGRRRRLLQGPHHGTRHHRRPARRGAARPRGARRTPRRPGPARRPARLRTHARSALRATVRHHRAHHELPLGPGRAARAPSRAEPGHAARGRHAARTRRGARRLTTPTRRTTMIPSRTNQQRALIALVQVLGLSAWFSATAVVPGLRAEWGMGSTAAVWLTASVQIGFVAGAVTSTGLNLADRVPPQYLLAAGALCAATCTAALTFCVSGLAAAIPLRFLTGLFLAGVYPVGMKLMASWSTSTDRGRAFGVLLAALTLGSALPHLIGVLGPLPWRMVLAAAAALTAAGAVVALLFVTPGPHLDTRAITPNPRYTIAMFAERGPRLANLGYFGHMWELYALWTWLSMFVLVGRQERGDAAASSTGIIAFT